MNEKLEIRRVPKTPRWELVYLRVSIGVFRWRSDAEDTKMIVENALAVADAQYGPFNGEDESEDATRSECPPQPTGELIQCHVCGGAGRINNLCCLECDGTGDLAVVG